MDSNSNSNSNNNNNNNQQINELNKTINEKDNLIQELYKENKELYKENKELYKQIQEKDKQIFELHKQIQEKDKQIQEKKIEEQEQQKNQEIFQLYKESRNEKDKKIKEMKKNREKYAKEYEILQIFKDSKIINDFIYAYYLKEWISNQELFHSFKLGFSATKDEFSNEIFHKLCDNKGESLAIIKSTNGCIFGGFTKIGFGSQGEWSNPDFGAFIFTLKNPISYPPSKFNYKSSHSIYRNPNYSVWFGNQHVGIKDLSSHSGMSSGYHYGNYEYPKGISPKDSNNFFTGFPTWEIEELEVYFK